MTLKTIKVLALLLLCSSFSSCQNKNMRTHYAKREYLRQQANKQRILTEGRIDTESSFEETISYESFRQKADWERQHYESIDDWLERLEKSLKENEKQVKVLKKELALIHEKEKTLTRKMQSMSYQNSLMREKIQSPSQKTRTVSYDKDSSKFSTPFVIHLVQPQESLKSIAIHYYGSEEMVDQIVHWNQGWIRHPDDVIAGLGLVLFSENALEKSPKSVEKYLNQL